jgi:uncharacterized protein YqgC (DUF456 family)
MDGWPIVVITATAMCVGLFGTIVPVVPGLALSLAAMVLYGVVSGFGSYGLVAVAVGAALFAFGTFLGVRIPQKHAAATGLRRSDQALALVLGVIGFFVIPVVGFPVGFVLGVFLAQYRRSRDFEVAKDATVVTLKALLKASAAQFACGCAMFTTWGAWVLLG